MSDEPSVDRNSAALPPSDAPESSTAAQASTTTPASSAADSSGSFGLGVLAFFLLQHFMTPAPEPFSRTLSALQSEDFRPLRSTPQTPKRSNLADLSTMGLSLARPTVQYWHETVVRLHPLRFHLPWNEGETVAEYYERYLREFTLAVDQARDVSTADVDPELVLYVCWVLEEVDLQLLILAEDDSFDSNDLPMEAQTERNRTVFQKLGEMSDQEFQNLQRRIPLKDRHRIDRGLLVQESVVLAYREVLEMQARLRSRYVFQQAEFSLPDLPAEVTQELEQIWLPAEPFGDGR